MKGLLSMGKIAQFMTDVNLAHHHYRWGRISKKELDERLQKLAKQYDRKVFKLSKEVEKKK